MCDLPFNNFKSLFTDTRLYLQLEISRYKISVSSIQAIPYYCLFPLIIWILFSVEARFFERMYKYKKNQTNAEMDTMYSGRLPEILETNLASTNLLCDFLRRISVCQDSIAEWSTPKTNSSFLPFGALSVWPQFQVQSSNSYAEYYRTKVRHSV